MPMLVGPLRPAIRITAFSASGSVLLSGAAETDASPPAAEDVPVAVLSPAPPAQEQSSLRYVVTPSGGLNLRETPSADARVMGIIPRGAQVTVEQEQDGWCQVAYEKLSGWVMVRYLQDEAP